MTMRNSSTTCDMYELEGEMDNGMSFYAHVDVEFKLGDDGIGPYEFWGTVYNDINYVYAPSSFFIKQLTVYDSDGEVIMEEVENKPENKTEDTEYLWDEVAAHVEGMLDDIDIPTDIDEADVVYDYDY